jgi:hypothetical protein
MEELKKKSNKELHLLLEETEKEFNQSKEDIIKLIDYNEKLEKLYNEIDQELKKRLNIK